MTERQQEIELICIDFDEDKHYYPMIETSIKLFVSDDNATAQMKAFDYVKNMNKQKLYMGHDKQIYPQFKFVVKEVK